MTNPKVLTPDALLVAARALHEIALAHYSITMPDSPATLWADLSEPSRRSYQVLAQKAAEAPTFEDFYAFTTLAEGLAGLGHPFADEDTERTRGARAQYALVRHLTSIEPAEAP